VFSTVIADCVAPTLRRMPKPRDLNLLIAFLIAGALTVSCSGGAGGSPAQAAVKSPIPDPATQRYVALVHNYWMQYKDAEGNVPRFLRVCWGELSPNAPNDTRVVDPVICGEIAAAILPPHEQFLSNLDATPAPAGFTGEDQTFRAQLPKAIADIKAMEAAAAAGDRPGVIDRMTAYADDMIPRVTSALDEVDPSVVHD
jgi:hypothetical protein